MHVNGKKMAVCGLTLAITEVLLILSGIFEFSTFFLLGAASFGIGIIIREFGLGLGGAFYMASVLLGFFLIPDKFYCATYAALAFYIWGIEFIHGRIGRLRGVGMTGRKIIFWIFKYAIFNLIYVPVLLFFPELLLTVKPSKIFFWGAVIGGQTVLFAYDRAYEYFQTMIWSRFRRQLLS